MTRGRRKRPSVVRARLETALVVAVLLAAGVLAGSFWLEWRRPRLSEESAPADPGADSLLLEARPKVEVLNGAGDRGAARRVAAYLRSAGFDVVYFGNAATFDEPKTRVLDRTGSGAAERVARALGLDSAQRRPDPELYLDATVVLGTDWRHLIAPPP